MNHLSFICPVNVQEFPNIELPVACVYGFYLNMPRSPAGMSQNVDIGDVAGEWGGYDPSSDELDSYEMFSYLSR